MNVLEGVREVDAPRPWVVIIIIEPATVYGDLRATKTTADFVPIVCIALSPSIITA